MVELGSMAVAAMVWMFRSAGGRSGFAPDPALDAAVERLRATVRGQLRSDPALARLEKEAVDGARAPSEHTRRRVVGALEEAGGRDAVFAAELRRVVLEVQEVAALGVSTAPEGIAVGRHRDLAAGDGSVGTGSRPARSGG
ncbi:hypothetical protein [Streptomyces profundus]|uniref:hypothetical protein n=1 Tax=Streptomyces profundus TaxID=2867410 RepID=UPI001D167D00|nr:hypothetical protein [Streptomyces sp. MA3_2.13]UED83536.1 hypothetical protein K4G22_04375 [Streptomyces sp. MA3_2.13]